MRGYYFAGLVFVESLFALTLIFLLVALSLSVTSADQLVCFVAFVALALVHLQTSRVLILLLQLTHVLWVACRSPRTRRARAQ